MTIRLDMRQAVSRAGNVLGESLDTVRGFLRGQLAADGGFQGRDGRSDLYYSVFGLEAALALSLDLPREALIAYLDGFGSGASLDFVHLTSLIRCRANLAEVGGPAAVVQQLLPYRAKDGGFSTAAGASRGSVYGSFLALAAGQDLGWDMPDTAALASSVRSLQMPDGGYSNEPTLALSATPATAAALCVFHYLKQPVPEAALRWLLDRTGSSGGFTAIAMPPDQAVPDLLSTATALFSLSRVGALPEDTREKHLDYLDSLWTKRGGFRGHWGDEVVDCEYTYYGLLSLGCLAG